jgi:hypothetical protein
VRRPLAYQVLQALELIKEILPPGYNHMMPLRLLMLLSVDPELARMEEPNVTGRGRAAAPAPIDRWLAALEREGLVRREEGSASLTEGGRAMIERMLDAIGTCSAYPVRIPIRRSVRERTDASSLIAHCSGCRGCELRCCTTRSDGLAGKPT